VLLPPSGPPLAFVADLDDPELDPGDIHHLAKVLRLRAGDALTIADGRGSWRAARFAPRPTVDGAVVAAPAPQPELTIAFALVKGDRSDTIVRQLTEISIDRIVPFVSARSIARPDTARAGRQVERWRRIAREAAMQCRRPQLPVVAEVTTFDELVAQAGVAGTEREGAPPDLDHPVLLVGPEGGWDPIELQQVPHVVALGPLMLRAETAAVAAGVLLAALRADLVSKSGRP
jgi:16S rRNA (uracil1498-N3)-methyltransferase